MLSQWINPEYLQENTILKYKQSFLCQNPFPHLEFKNFFKEEKATLILEALQREKFILKESDLFKFKQTNDLQGSSNTPLREFRALLSSEEFINYLSKVTSTSLKQKRIDLSGTLYEDTDFLLCHDDRLEGRKIAFFYYLSDLEKKDGGYLKLYSSENSRPLQVQQQIIPRFNIFAFFLVSRKSFHSVEEMMSKKKRSALSGWFHGP